MLRSPCQSHTWGCRQFPGGGGGQGSEPRGRGAVTLASETAWHMSAVRQVISGSHGHSVPPHHPET